MKKNLLLVCLCLLYISGFSQATQYKLYDWDVKPIPDTMSYDTSLHAIYLTEKTIKELVYEDDKLIEYHLTHHKIKLLTDKAVNTFNKRYIQQYYNGENIIEKARVINKDGSVVDLDKSSIKEGKDSDTGNDYRYFAFEGVEAGGEIEYLYVIKKAPYLYGIQNKVQTEYPIYNFKYDFYAPKNLEFKFKSYNNLPEIVRDTSYKDANYWHIELDTVVALKEEQMSNYENDIMSFIFKLHRNYATGANDITSYGPWSKRAFEFVHNIDKKQKAIIKKFIKDIKPDESSEEKTIRSVEDYLKKNYAYYDLTVPDLSDLSKIYTNKAFNSDGAIISYANIFKELSIEYEIIVTNNRWNLKFDKSFESYSFLDEFLIYFPKIKKIMSPNSLYSRLGFPPQEFSNNYGLFIKEISMGEFSSAIGKIKFIEPSPMNKTANNINVEVNFIDNFIKAELVATQELSGYDAYYYQPIFQLIVDEDKLKEFKEEIVNIFSINDEPDNYEFINDNGSDFGIKPLIINSTFTTEELTEKAGETYLFKVGQLIGPQMELYLQEEKRKEDIEFLYSREYNRHLTINIPDGYSAKNLENLQYNNTYINEKGDTLFAFLSDYTIQSNKIIINMKEWYDGLNFSKDVWENYREVVNSAANFNKVNIFFIKEE